MNFTGPKEIKLHVRKILESWKEQLSGKSVLDLPSGNGHSLEILKNLGANVTGGDIFPELNRVKDAKVVYADLSARLPFDDETFDFVLCQEGIEHVGNQDLVFSEFSRVLKTGGRLLLTTPNYSNLKSRMSYLLTESEAFGRIMPPNERETIWLSTNVKKTYFGHVFLTGITRLRLFGLVAGLYIEKTYSSRVNYTSLILLPIFYPFIFLYSFKTYRRFVRKTGAIDTGRDLFKLMTSPSVLLENHLILEFKKRNSPEQAAALLKSVHDSGMTT